MKTCPNCQELLGDNAKRCFNCKYDFQLGRVISRAEEIKIANTIEEQHRLEGEKRKQEIEEYQENRQKNAKYEYEVVVLSDKATGEFDVESYRSILNSFSAEGWRLKSVFSNEIGKNATSIGIGGISSQVNATIEQTIITFERCIRPSSFYEK